MKLAVRQQGEGDGDGDGGGGWALHVKKTFKMQYNKW